MGPLRPSTALAADGAPSKCRRPTRYGASVRRGFPAGTVTFFFTHIADSTRRWEDDPMAMADALRAHDAIVRSTIERHGGYVFDTGGDGMRAAFSTPADAAAAAIESQERLRDDEAIDFAVGMALHTAEAADRDGSYVGNEVNRAARLLMLAHGGQVLVSDATEGLLRHRLTLRPLGESRLHGLRGRMSVHQLVADGLPSEFPVLRLDQFPGNLPQQLSSLVGREQLVDEVAELVQSRRLVTLTGVGGVGKTRLALEVGAEVAGDFPDGVWMVELAPVGDPSAVPAAIAAELGVTPRGDAPLMEVVAESLVGRRLLLVIDNCEHVQDAARAAMQTMLARPGDSRLLATSREALALDEEVARTVAPLALEGGAASDAVTLFVDRARVVRPELRPRGAGDRDRRDRDLSDRRRPPAGDRTGRGEDGSHERRRGPGSARGPVPSVAGLAAGAGTTAHPPPYRGVVLRPPHRRRARTAPLHVGVRRRLRPDERLQRGRRRGRCGRAPSARLPGPQIARRRRPQRHAHPVRPLRDHPPVRRRTGWRRRGRSNRHAIGTRSISRGRRRRGGNTGTGRGGAPQSTGSRWSWATCGRASGGATARGDVQGAADIAAHAALMGFSVQLFETLTWAEDLLEPAAAAGVRRLPRLYTAAGYACFVGRAEQARANAHRATELEDDPRYDACEPGYASFIEALASVYCGDLDRYVELTGAVVEQYGSDTRLRHRLVRRRSPIVRPGRGGARPDRGVHRGRTIAR